MAASSEQSIIGSVIDSESPAELVRLLNQERFFTGRLGLLPDGLEVAHFRTVLNIGCGPGGWALEVAKTYPSMQVTGVDSSSRVIDFARAQAESQQIHNVTFVQADTFDTDSFPEASFDFINARPMLGFMSYQYWWRVAAEYKHLLRPGGVLCLTDAELPMTSGPVCQQFFEYMAAALNSKKYTQSRWATQVTLSLQPALRAAKYEDIQHNMYQLEFSYDTDDYETNCQNIVALVSLMRPVILGEGVAKEKDYDRIQHDLLGDLYASGFMGQWFVLSAWGRKPA
jgi:ubiquinone/menaquinone biosynthesis C-methylase UbiE